MLLSVLVFLFAETIDTSHAAAKTASKSQPAQTAAVDKVTWTEVDRLVGEQKMQAALEKTKEIIERAKVGKDARLWTEAQVRATQLQIGLHGYETAVRDLKDQPWPNDPAGRVLLNLFYTHALMQYQSVYSWEIRTREKTVSTEKVDLKAWTSLQIGTEISRSFDDVMKNAPALAEPSPDFFATYVRKNGYPKGIRPFLRDVTVYMAVRHLSNTQYWSPKEMAEVYRVDANRLATEIRSTRIPAVDVTKHPLEKIASWLGEHREFHKKAGRVEGALNAQYELLMILHGAFSEEPDRSSVRIALKTLQKSHHTVPWWSHGQAILAGFIIAESRPGRLIDARAEALAGMKAYPESYGGLRCKSIVQDIERPNYSIMNMSSDNPSRRSSLISYKNLTKLYFRAYSLDAEQLLKSTRNYGNVSLLQELQKSIQLDQVKPGFEWFVDLQPTPDYAHHRKFVVAPMKKPGLYAILVSSRSDFSGNNDIVQATKIVISDLVMATASQPDGTLETRVLSGEKGTAVKNAEVSLYRFLWNKSPQLVETKKTDEGGFTNFNEPKKAKDEYWNYYLVGRKEGQLALELDRIYFGRESGPSPVTASFVYTDRSIYRPQQKILWKIAGYSGADYRAGVFTSAEAGKELSIRLIDPNHQQVEIRKVKIGEFGTASGDFLIPTGRPLGSWQVEVVGKFPGRAGIRVEEYKRPTFETKLQDAAQPMRLNRKSKVSGEAKYYGSSRT